MLKIIYTANGKCIADHSARDWAHSIAASYNSGDDTAIYVSNETVVDAIRAEVKWGNIHYSEVLFFNNEERDGEGIKIDRYGSLEEWPEGFCDVYTNTLLDLLK